MGMDTETAGDTNSYCYREIGSGWIFSAPIPANDDFAIRRILIDYLAYLITR